MPAKKRTVKTESPEPNEQAVVAAFSLLLWCLSNPYGAMVLFQRTYDEVAKHIELLSRDEP